MGLLHIQLFMDKQTRGSQGGKERKWIVIRVCYKKKSLRKMKNFLFFFLLAGEAL